MSQEAVAGGSAVLSGLIASWAEGQRNLTMAKNMRLQNKAKIKQLNQYFQFQTQNVANNYGAINQQKLRNDLNIEENKLEAESQFAQVFGISGIRGRTVDTTETEIAREVATQKNESERIAQEQTSRQFMGLMRADQNIQQQIKDLNIFDADAAIANQDMAGYVAFIQSAASSAGSLAGK